jgi:DNA-binding PadR family transcriptional regulator
MLLDEFILGSKERIVKAFLDVVMLSLLSKHAMSGYEIDKELVKKFGLMIGPSTIYSKLSTLEKQGFISCATSRSGKVYSLTEDGKQLEANTESVLDNVCGFLIGKLRNKS